MARKVVINTNAMSESGYSYAAPALPATAPNATADTDDQKLRELLKRCPPATLRAARQFRRTRRAEYVSPIVLGVLSRYVSRDLDETIRNAHADLRLNEDLGVDSLSLIEISMTLEDVLQISLSDEKLRQLRTLGDINRYTQECLKV